jgi:hypothetical protein
MLLPDCSFLLILFKFLRYSIVLTVHFHYLLSIPSLSLIVDFRNHHTFKMKFSATILAFAGAVVASVEERAVDP